MAFAYSLATPLYEPTDEIRHFRYVRHLITYRSLPVQQAEEPRAQSHHPPLYYTLGALATFWVPEPREPYYEPPLNPYWGYRYWEVSDDNKNQYLHGEHDRLLSGGVALSVYVVRLFTIAIGAVTVWLAYRMARFVLGGSQLLATGAVAVVALNPQFLHLSGSIGNDVPATLCSVAVLLVCLEMMQHGLAPRTDVGLGVLLGLALLTKFNLVALSVPIGLAYLLGSLPGDGSGFHWRSFVRGILTVLGVAALISGWWFWRNQALYGDLTGMGKVSELWSGRDPSQSWWALRQSLPYLWSSLWGRFGYGQVPLHRPAYIVLLVFSSVAFAGHLLRKPRQVGPRVLVFLLTTFLVFTAVTAYYILIQPAGAMGRFLFPALPAFAILAMLGMRRYLPARLDWVAGLVATVVMLALSLYAFVGVLLPAFAPPRPLSAAQVGAAPNPVGAELGGVATLLGYTVSPTTVYAGGIVDVTLYWRAEARTDRDYAVFVHLLSDVGTIVAQRDTYPGLGRYPTTAWEAGVAFVDRYRIHVPETAYSPDRGYVQAGMYLPGGPRLSTPDGRDAIRLETITVAARPGDVPNPLDVNFGDRVALVGYDVDRRTARPGEAIRLTLYWRAISELEDDYSVFAHVLGDENQVWARSDGWPGDVSRPTTTWVPGQVVEDVRALKLDPTTPPYLYQVEVGVYVPGKAPIPVVADDGHWLDQRVLLGQIRVTDE